MLKSITILTGVASRAAPWLRQTSTIGGIATLAGLLVGLLTGEASWQVELPVAVGALVAMALPGHPEAQSIIAQVAVDAVAAATPAGRSEGLKALARDIPTAVNVTLTAQKSGTTGNS